jgi:hypothetical protein
MLRALSGAGTPQVSREAVEAEVRRELAGQLTARLLQMVGN